MALPTKLCVIGASLVFATLAQAAPTTYASNPVYAGATGGDPVTCRVFNPGPGNATFNSTTIVSSDGNFITPTSNSCTRVLNAFSSCAFQAPSPGNLAFTCYVQVVGPHNNLTGIAEINEGGGVFATQAFVRQP